jgi:hypothetical protein
MADKKSTAKRTAAKPRTASARKTTARKSGARKTRTRAARPAGAKKPTAKKATKKTAATKTTAKKAAAKNTTRGKLKSKPKSRQPAKASSRRKRSHFSPGDDQEYDPLAQSDRFEEAFLQDDGARITRRHS